MKPLGRLEKVDDLRSIWASEAGDFTPWLAQPDNLKLLGDTIGLELELEATEQNVGPFRADILCKDTASNSWVLVENQIERTDHSHLGQLLTYAAGLTAVTIVWIAERFTDEHRAALDWLNEVTDEEINFFGLEVELWRIEDSPVAPKFNVVSKPNDWTRTVSASREHAEGEISSTGQLQLEYWTAFREYLLEKRSFIHAQKPLPQHWMYFAVGRTNFVLSAAMNTRDKVVTVNLEITGPYKQSFYSQLEQQCQAIEAEMKDLILVWRPLPDKKSSIIRTTTDQFDPGDKAHWSNLYEWLCQTLETFHRVFATRVKNLTSQEDLLTSGE